VGPGLTRRLAVVTDDRHRHHDPPFELNGGSHVAPVWERPGRIEALRSGLAAVDHDLVAPTAHDDAAVLAVHDPDLVAFLRDGYRAWRAAGGPDPMIPDTFISSRWAAGARAPTSPLGAAGWWCFDTATPVVAGSWTAARAAVDVALTAADLAVAGTPVAYALTRPPGHHTGVRAFGGFCLLNPAAIAARSLAEVGRVAVVDVDVHHGNGTQEVFWDDPQVHYTSLHGDPAHLFPYATGHADEVGGGPARGTTRNLPLPRGTDDAGYLAAFESALETVDRFDPATVLVSLGLDAAAADPLGTLGLTLDGFAGVGARLAQLGRPLVLVQEGGYAIEVLGDALAATLRGLGITRNVPADA
jgi:acetoin utilization deacetylase AcuC-like enzyme